MWCSLKIQRNLGKLRFYGSADPWEGGILGINLPKKSTKIVKIHFQAGNSGRGGDPEIPTVPKILKSQNPQGWEVKIPQNPWIFLKKEQEYLPEKDKDPKNPSEKSLPPHSGGFSQEENSGSIKEFRDKREKRVPGASQGSAPRYLCGYFGSFPTKSRSEFHIIPENPGLGGEKRPKSQFFR